MTFNQWLQNNRGLLGTGCALSPEDRLRAAWQAGQAQCAAGEWQRIEAAPDWATGESVLCMNIKSGKTYLAWWYPEKKQWRSRGNGSVVKPTHFARLHEVQP
jgi:hypothetical protein